MAPCKGYEPKAGIGELPAEMDQGARRLVGTRQSKDFGLEVADVVNLQISLALVFVDLGSKKR